MTLLRHKNASWNKFAFHSSSKVRLIYVQTCARSYDRDLYAWVYKYIDDRGDLIKEPDVDLINQLLKCPKKTYVQPTGQSWASVAAAINFVILSYDYLIMSGRRLSVGHLWPATFIIILNHAGEFLDFFAYFFAVTS